MRSIIDPVSRIEGHLRVEMEVEGGHVSQAWVSGGLFRGMELILRGREPADAAVISQRICGVCPVSHAHASSMAGEAATGIEELPNAARIVRNIVEGAQFLHSNILWFYNLTGLDYVDPTNALTADVAAAYDLARQWGTAANDLQAVHDHLESFVENGQLSLFTGNWFSREGYKLTPEMDLVATAHYLEALEYQAKASEIAGLVGGKMPHIMSSVPGGTTFVPTVNQLSDILFRAQRIRDWVERTMVPDTLGIADPYRDSFGYGRGVERYVAWGVFNDPTQLPENRYLPAGVIDDRDGLSLPNEALIKEYTGHSFYASDGNLNPRQGLTDPLYPAGGADLNGKYTWTKGPSYDGKPHEAGPLARMLVAYLRDVPRIKELVDGALSALGSPGQLSLLHSTLGRVVARNLETLYVAERLVEWIEELIAAVSEGDSSFFTEPVSTTGEGCGMWEAPRGALYHFMRIVDNRIQDYQVIVPTTWNIAPRDADGIPGPMETALEGVPVDDPEKPIDALRTVHSFDPCVSCSVHVSEPATGKRFEAVTHPWGVA
ncbi:MAG: nickel-dependent hydrogenase large subunit [Coriobacteriales bacterium]|jgi:[NiFe] hydrogenase large subunit